MGHVRQHAVAALLRRLRAAADLCENDLEVLSSAVREVRRVRPRTVLIEEGDRPEHVHVVLDGFACRYKSLPDGNRQILAWLLPGEFCDLHVAILGNMDHTVATLSASTIGLIPQDQVEMIIDTSPALSRALWWAALVQEAVIREWLVGMGRRDAESRAAHLFCELHARLDAIGLVRDGAVDFPLTQGELADTLGLSAVHANRVVQGLRQQRLIAWKDRKIRFERLDALQDLAQFDPNYLHLKRRAVAPQRGQGQSSREAASMVDARVRSL